MFFQIGDLLLFAVKSCHERKRVPLEPLRAGPRGAGTPTAPPFTAQPRQWDPRVPWDVWVVLDAPKQPQSVPGLPPTWGSTSCTWCPPATGDPKASSPLPGPSAGHPSPPDPHCLHPRLPKRVPTLPTNSLLPPSTVYPA